MQWVWLIPSLGYGVYIFATTGQPYGLIFGGFSALAFLGNSLFQSRREPVDVKQPVHFGAKRIAIGNRVLPRWEWRWHATWVTRVYQELQELNAQHNSRVLLHHRIAGPLSTANPDPLGLEAWLGFAGQSEVRLDLAAEGAHAIVAGATGSGKSQLLTTWLVSVCQNYPPAKLRLKLFDFKGGATLGPFAATEWAGNLITDLQGDQTDALGELVRELQDRERLLSANQVGRLQDLDAEHRPPLWLIVIDEVQVLLQNHDSHRPLETIAARGRSLGLHLILTSQSLSGVPRGLVTNCGLRIGVGKCDPIDLAQLGYSRVSPIDPQFGANRVQIGPLPGLSESAWASAVLISPKRQVEFNFPSAGLVSAKKLVGLSGG